MAAIQVREEGRSRPAVRPWRGVDRQTFGAGAIGPSGGAGAAVLSGQC